jgi:hypothetical protein
MSRVKHFIIVTIRHSLACKCRYDSLTKVGITVRTVHAV